MGKQNDSKSKQADQAKSSGKIQASPASQQRNFVRNFLTYFKMIAKSYPESNLARNIEVFESLILQKATLWTRRTIYQKVLGKKDYIHLGDEILRDIVQACDLMLNCQEVREKCSALDDILYSQLINKFKKNIIRRLQPQLPQPQPQHLQPQLLQPQPLQLQQLQFQPLQPQLQSQPQLQPQPQQDNQDEQVIEQKKAENQNQEQERGFFPEQFIQEQKEEEEQQQSTGLYFCEDKENTEYLQEQAAKKLEEQQKYYQDQIDEYNIVDQN